MANTKISALDAAASIADADVRAGVQRATNEKFAVSDIKEYGREHVDANYAGWASGNQRNVITSFHPVRAAAGTWYAFVIEVNSLTLCWVKTTNYGASWSQPVQVSATVCR